MNSNLQELLRIENDMQRYGQITPEARVTCREHQCYNDVVHREREH